MTVLFWLSIWFIVYTYLGYPLLIWFLSICFNKPVKANPNFMPPISIVISAYNEALHIEKKIKSIYSSNYPKERIEVLVGLDGCTDSTFDILKKMVDKYQSLKIYNYPYRRGKPFVLNDLIDKVQHNIIVFTDARQPLEIDALRKLVSPLSDSSVGSVSGELVFLDEKGDIKENISLYWRYEKFIRYCESNFFSMLGATGAFYAMRREFVKKLPENIILDDVYQPFNAIKSGVRAIFKRGAIVYDTISTNEVDEFNRKVRTLIGNFQLIKIDPFLLSFKNPVLWQFLSHKVFRLFVPYAMFIVYICSFTLVWQYCWAGIFFALQTLFYVIGFYPLAIGVKPKHRLLSLPYTFLLLNLASVVAMLKFIKSDYSVKWRN